MSVLERNHVHVQGQGRPMIFVHGFGCDQNMWRLLAPHFASRFRTILVDLVGSGNSQLAAYDKRKYGTLQGHADDMCEVLREVALGATYREIGEKLFIAEKTVENHVRNILDKLRLRRRAELVRWAVKRGMDE